MSYMDVDFNVYHGGYWAKDYKGDLAYLEGEEVISIACNPEELFIRLSTELRGEGIYGQKMWYKLPFEEHKDRKRLSNQDVSFEKMCEAGRWTGVVDIFLVNSSEHAHDVDIQEPCDAENRVERNVACFVDEDPNYDYHDTPPNSDDEDRGEFVKFKKSSGKLQLKQVFDSLEDFKEGLVDYALKEGCNIKLDRWGKVKCGAICSMDGCNWRIYGSYHESIGKWVVKTDEDHHSCVPDGFCKLLKTGVIAKTFMNEIRSNPDYSPKSIQYEIQKNFNLMTTIDVCKKAKRKVLEIIHRDHLEQFSRLKDYKDAILASNPNSTVELDTIIGDDGSEIFRRFYVCFDVIRRLWSMWCRPIFGIDGCFLKSTLKGQLLAAMGRDANNGAYPIAWAVVDVEDEENWTWFIQKLKDDFNLQEGQGYTVISDRQKGLLNAVDKVLPHIEHRMCARHIYGNLKKIFPNQSEVKRLFWRVAESYTVADYEANLEQVEGMISVYMMQSWRETQGTAA